MLSAGCLSINAFDKTALETARKLGLGLEVEEYLWMYREEEVAQKRERVSEMIPRFSRLSFHGTAVSRDIVATNNLTDEELLSIYDESYENSRFQNGLLIY